MGVARKFLTARAISQILFTIFTVSTSLAALIFALQFQSSTKVMKANFRGEMTGTGDDPCVRNTMPDCDNLEEDTCYVSQPTCCPPNYHCERDPVVGLYCQHGQASCGNAEWCRYFADISKQCKTEICQQDRLVAKMTRYALVFSALAVLTDVIDIVAFCACPDAVVFKSLINLCSSCIKWGAFTLIVGSGAKEFMVQLVEAGCYHSPNDSALVVERASDELLWFILLQVGSAVLSIILAPLSAYYGGKLVGVPYVK